MPVNVSEIAALTVVAAAGFAFANFILSHAWRGQGTGLVYSNILLSLYLSLITAFVPPILSNLQDGVTEPQSVKISCSG